MTLNEAKVYSIKYKTDVIICKLKNNNYTARPAFMYKKNPYNMVEYIKYNTPKPKVKKQKVKKNKHVSKYKYVDPTKYV